MVGFGLADAKSRGSRRVIAFDARTVSILRDHRKRQNEERLGHSSISITLDRYGPVIEGMDREAAETVAGLIR